MDCERARSEFPRSGKVDRTSCNNQGYILNRHEKNTKIFQIGKINCFVVLISLVYSVVCSRMI